MQTVCIPEGHFRCIHPIPDRWGFEPSIDYQLLPGRKPGVFTDVYKFAQDKKSGAIFDCRQLLLCWFFLFNPQSKTKFLRDEL